MVGATGSGPGIEPRSARLIHAFDDPPPVSSPELPGLLGGKGASLVTMTAVGLPVPPGFTLTTEACRRYTAEGWSDELESAVRAGLARLEAQVGKGLGDAAAPLLLSIRSGAEVSMPGMMDTILDVGMQPDVEAALARQTGDTAFAADTHRRLLLSFAEVVCAAPPELLQRARAASSPTAVTEVLAGAGITVPADPIEQVVAAVCAVFDSWRSPRAVRYREVEAIDDALGTAVTVQMMVFGNLGPASGTGVAFSRDPATGTPGITGDFLPEAQGEDVVAGGRRTLPLGDMASSWPEQHAELARVASVLEHEFADMVDLEFTVEQGRLWLLQARRAKRSPTAVLRCAVDMAEDPDFPVDRAEAVRRCAPFLDDPPTIAPTSDDVDGCTIATGLAASPGRATGVLCTDPDEAVAREAAGEAVILVRNETSPADVHGMAASVGIFTLLGGLVSHAAVVARDWGLPAVVGASEARITDAGLEGPGGVAAVGATVTVDGDAGALYRGGAAGGREPIPEVQTVRRWDESM